VVADEVRKLSTLSSVTGNKIYEKVNVINKAITAVIAVAEKSARKIRARWPRRKKPYTECWIILRRLPAA